MRRVSKWSWIWLALGALMFVAVPGCTKSANREPTAEEKQTEQEMENQYKQEKGKSGGKQEENPMR